MKKELYLHGPIVCLQEGLSGGRGGVKDEVSEDPARMDLKNENRLVSNDYLIINEFSFFIRIRPMSQLGQPYRKRRAAPHTRTIRDDGPSVQLHQMTDHRETQSQPGMRPRCPLLRLPEPLKNKRQEGRWNPLSVIPHDNFNLARPLLRGDIHAAAIWSELDRIGPAISDHLEAARRPPDWLDKSSMSMLSAIDFARAAVRTVSIAAAMTSTTATASSSRAIFPRRIRDMSEGIDQTPLLSAFRVVSSIA